MADNSVGQIGLDLVVNDNSFKKQMSGIQGIAKKAGAALAAAFAVKKLVDFGAKCIELGSDLQEVQNVVDVTFPRMSKQVDAFAQKAAASFGLSETMAKKFTGTFSSMAKAFGFGEKAAYDMSTTLTGLAGDVASFYNISQDLAYTKLKSVFSGETETLKDLGIVMTQSALDAYALANGFGKTTKAMSEAEKVALRYQFIQDKLALASGDFIRTSDGWANQVRILKLQFDSLKATIGQGLINVLTPIIKVINTIIGKLMSLANAFKSFTELITGKKNNGADANMSAVADAAENAADATGNVGSAAKKAVKEMKALAGFDELSTLASSPASGSGGEDSVSADTFDMGMGEIDTSAIDEVDSKYQKLIDKAKELKGYLKAGFTAGLGDVAVFDSIRTSLQRIKDSFISIAADKGVQKAADGFINNFTYNLGQLAGSAISIGASIADNLFGGLDQYLKGNSGRIKEYLISMFDIGADFGVILGDVSVLFSKIGESLRSGGAKQITSDIIGIFTNGFMGITELAARFGKDVISTIATPFTANAELIKNALEKTFSAIAPVFSELKSIVDEFFQKANETYVTYFSPMMEELKQGFTDIVALLLDLYNQYILPVIEGFAEKFSQFREQHLSPLIDKFMEFAGKVAEAVSTIWNQTLKPFIEWFATTIAPIIAENINTIINTFFTFLTHVKETLSHIIDALGGLIDIIVGVFTGDWNRAWEGVKVLFVGIWKAIESALSAIFTGISLFIEAKLLLIKSVWETIWEGIKLFFINTWESVKKAVALVLEDMRNGISNSIAAIKEAWNNTWEGLRTATQNIFGGIWDNIRGVINNIISGIETMANSVVAGVNTMISALNGLKFDVPGWVPVVGGKSLGFTIPTIPEVKIPKLANGGYVKANTPQLAMIGDNRHQGEVVAPEDKIYKISLQAMTDAMRPLMSMLASLQANGNREEIKMIVTGELAPLFRWLNIELEKEKKLIGANFEVV